MGLRKSVVFTVLCPPAETDAAAFAAGLDALKARGVSVAEFFAPFGEAASRRALLAGRGMEGIFLAALHQKRNGYNLSALDGELRAHTIRETEKCIDAAADADAGRVLVTSGALPPDGARLEEAVCALEESLVSLSGYAARRGVELLLEPGDRAVQARQVVGPTQLAVDVCGRVLQRGGRVSLTMDTSHLAQLGEDVRTALVRAKPHCAHIHLANCILKPGHPMYGDRHPQFSDPDGVFTLGELREIGAWCAGLYAGEDLTLSFEIICHDPSDAGFFEKVLREEEWFFAL